MFIAEESMQTAMFAAFAYQSAEDWEGLEWHIENVMKPTHKSAELIVGVGCIPGILFCKAYSQYLKANAGYIRSVEHRLDK
jgi:hypothetical protein